MWTEIWREKTKKMEKMFSQLFSHRNFDTLRDLVYMFYLC